MKKLAIISLLLALCCSACSTVKVFENRSGWRREKLKTERVALLSDALIIDETGRDTNKVDLLENCRIADSLTARTALWLRARKMPVQRTLPSSVGMTTQSRKPLYIVRDLSERDKGEDALTFGLPPFFIDSTMMKDASLMQALSAPRPASDGFIARSVIFLWRISAYNIPTGKSVVQGVVTGLLTTILTLGMFTGVGYQTSGIAVSLTVIDEETGEILWAAADRGDTYTDENAATTLAMNILRTLFDE